KDSNKVFAEIINENVDQLAGLEGKDDDFRVFKSSLKTSVDVFIKSVKDLETNNANKPVLKLPKLERDFIQKIRFITQKFEGSELKARKKPDLIKLDEKESYTPVRTSLMSELKTNIDDRSKVLKKLDKKDLVRRHEKSEMIPFLKCFSCTFEQQFPIHCKLRMDYEDGQLICEKCKEKIPIPKCSSCNQPLGIGVKKMKID
ncbi:MAG: hypothetical protein ACTSPC_07820, partial [Candidatus Heimdallarchaeota archaeon]